MYAWLAMLNSIAQLVGRSNCEHTKVPHKCMGRKYWLCPQLLNLPVVPYGITSIVLFSVVLIMPPLCCIWHVHRAHKLLLNAH